MQTVLSIDISSKSAEAVVANIEGKNIQVLERHRLDITEFLSSLVTPQQNHENGELINENMQNDGPAKEGTEGKQSQNPIIEILSKITHNWNNAILTVPSQDYLSMNLDLPFNDNRSINRILDLEIQDLVPFEIQDFHLCHKSIAASPLNGEEAGVKYDTHVGIISKSHINRIMDLCHQANFEPFIVTTPCSALGSVLTLAPLYFAENSLILLERLPDYYMITSYDGLIRGEKIITHPSFQHLSNGNGSGVTISDANKSILMDLKLFIASTEKRYGKNLDKIYYFGKNFTANDLQNSLTRSIEILKVNEFIPLENEEPCIAAMAAVYAEENNSSLIINNFRARQYAYNQKLKYLLKSSTALLPVLGIFLACLFVYLCTKYLINEYSIHRLNSAVNTEIRNALPNMEIPNGQELKSLQGENQKLEDQLNDISSLSSMTPLDLLLEISKDLPSSLGLSIKAVRIKDNKLVIEGSAKAYSDVDNVKKILERKPLYQRVKKVETSTGAAHLGMRPFSFEIWVKE
jgi:hypothetical protein